MSRSKGDAQTRSKLVCAFLSHFVTSAWLAVFTKAIDVSILTSQGKLQTVSVSLHGRSTVGKWCVGQHYQ